MRRNVETGLCVIIVLQIATGITNYRLGLTLSGLARHVSGVKRTVREGNMVVRLPV